MFWRGDDKLLVRYLLGELSEGRRVRLEEELVASEDCHQRLLLAEDELVDAYVRDELSAARRARFETRFLMSAEQKSRIEIARDLKAVGEKVAEHEPEIGPGLSSRKELGKWLVSFGARPAFAATAAALLVVAVLVLPPPPENPQLDGTQLSAVMLMPSVRSETVELPRLELAKDTRVVELEAWVEDKRLYRSFRALLQTSRGETLWRSKDDPKVFSTETDATIRLSLPATVFERSTGSANAARHLLKLEAVDFTGRLEVIGEYEFEVIELL